MIYVDCARNRFGRMIMSHMIADTETELHQFAAILGINHKYFQPKSFPHYDVSQSKREAALRLGAKLVDDSELVQIIRNRRLEKING